MSYAAETLTRLTRLAHRDPERRGLLRTALRSDLPRLAPVALKVAMETGDPIGQELAALLAGADLAPDLADTLLKAMPIETVALREAAVVCARRLWTEAQQTYREQNEAAIADYVGAANQYAFRLREIGQSQEAYEVASRAVRMCRAVQEQATVAGTPYAALASALNTLSAAAQECGRPLEAVAAAEESATMYAALGNDADVADALNDLAASLGHVGRFADAVEAAARSVAVRRQLVGDGQRGQRRNLANSLHTLALAHADAGALSSAIDAGLEAHALLVDLTDAHPDGAHLADLANTCNTLATIYSELGESSQQLHWAGRAVAHYEALAGRRPEAFEAELATALMNLAEALSAEQPEEATAIAQRAAAIYQRRFDDGVASARALADSLLTLSIRQYLARDLSGAERTCRDALRHYEQAHDGSLADTVARARGLGHLATLLSETQRSLEARDVAARAEAGFRTQYETDQDAGRAELAQIRQVQAVLLHELQDRDGARAALEEVVALRRDLRASIGDGRLLDLMLSMTQLALLTKDDDPSHACATVAELRRLLRDLDAEGEARERIERTVELVSKACHCSDEMDTG